MYSILELVELSKQDKRYMETLWIALQKRCIKWAKKVQRVEGDWEDLYQEAYFVLTKVVEAYDVRKNVNFEAYFAFALTNRARNYYRQHITKREHEFLPEDKEEDKDFYGEIIDETNNTEQEVLQKLELIDMLGRLNEDEQYILKAFYFWGQNREKISHHLGVSCDAVDARKRRALKKIKSFCDGF